MARIYKRGKSWYIDIRVKGNRIRKRVGRSKRIAELALKDAEVKIARDEFGFAKNDIALDKLIRQFLDFSRMNHAPGTTRRFTCVSGHFQNFLREKHPKITHLSQINSELMERYKIYRTDPQPDRKQVKPSIKTNGNTRKIPQAETVNYELKVLTVLFNEAISWGYLKDNPTRNVKRLKIKKSKQAMFLSKEECHKLLKACPENLFPIYFTFLNTGMRKSELEYLEWDDIDFRRRKIKIRRKEMWQPKTGEREIPINQQLLDLLKDLRSKNDRGLKGRFVFPHKRGGRIKTNLREKLVQIGKKAGIENLTKVHTLRHTFASHLVMNGVDLPTVKNLMGHSDIETTMIYAHLAPDHLADAVDKLSF